MAVVRENGDSDKQTIETGWQEYRDLYGDSRPHFFIYYTTTGDASSGDDIGGYNLDVDGFVQVSSTVFPGAVISNLSVLNGVQYSSHFRVQLYYGNWWIKYNNTWIGYYPASLFDAGGLRFKADKVSWYGEIVDLDDGVNTYTDMGSGRWPSEGWQRAAYMRNLVIYDLEDGPENYAPDATIGTPGCYAIQGHFGSTSSWKSHCWFGGPGKSITCP